MKLIIFAGTWAAVIKFMSRVLANRGAAKLSTRSHTSLLQFELTQLYIFRTCKHSRDWPMINIYINEKGCVLATHNIQQQLLRDRIAVKLPKISLITFALLRSVCSQWAPAADCTRSELGLANLYLKQCSTQNATRFLIPNKRICEKHSNFHHVNTHHQNYSMFHSDSRKPYSSRTQAYEINYTYRLALHASAEPLASISLSINC
jgi:hypothetical protein